MKKIVHIHSDPKFLGISREIFDCSSFQNEYYLVTRGDDPAPDDESLTVLKPTRSSLKKLVEAGNRSDLTVVFDLDAFKSRLVNRLDPDVKTAWRFFGYELYTRDKKTYLSEHTLKAIRNSGSVASHLYRKIRDTVVEGLSVLRWGTFTEPAFREAIQNLDYFMGLYREEYDHLKESWPDLPAFVKLPLRKPGEYNSGYLEEKSPTVIVGNSRSVFNNHLDVLELIKQTGPEEKIDFRLLFNYGHDYGYADAVRSVAREMPSVHMVEKFLPYEEFVNLYSTVGALVINAYRQLAMANIRQALGSGVKVYLNTKNTAYHHLVNDGFRVFTIEDFAKDIKTANIILPEDDRVHNYQKLGEAYEEYPIPEFQDQIRRLI